MPACETLSFLERFEDQPLFLCAHPAQRPDAAVERRALEIVQRADAELAIQRRDGLRADSLQVEQIEHGRRKLGDELAMKRGIAGLGNLSNARGEILPDPWNLAKPGLVEPGEIVRMIRDDVAAIAVRANLERVVVLDLEEIGNLQQDARNRGVIQSAGP